MAAEVPFENPLIPNARLRGMYLAMLRARRLEEALPPKRRAWTAGLEASLVAPAIDLGPGDLVSDAVRGGTVEFLRGQTLDSVFAPGKRTGRAAVLAEAGLAAALPCAPGVGERLWGALGAAAGLKARALSASNVGRGRGISVAGEQRGVAVIYVRAGEGSAALRRDLFGFAAEHLLPVVFVVLPASGSAADAGWAKAAGRSGLPVIAADCGDAVAIYRVAQESIGRARAGGGPAVIQCARFVVEGKQGLEETADPLLGIERYILERSIATPEWIARQTRTLALRLAGPVH